MRIKINGTDDLIDAYGLQEMGFTRSMAYSILNRKDIPVIKIGRRKFVRTDQFDEWLEKQGKSAEDE